MTHSTKTLANGKIILATIGEYLSLEEWAQVSIQIMDAVQQSHESVHVIVDMSLTKRHPVNALEIHKVTIWTKSPKVQTVNHITNNRLTSILGDVVVGLVAQTYRSMNTMEEAFQRIIAADSSITESLEELTKALP